MSPAVRDVRRRGVRVVGYAMMAAAGAVAFAIPISSIRASTGWLVYVWAGFLLIGGIACGLGAFTDRWIGELLGLPLVSSAWAVYFVVLILARTASGAAAGLAFGAVAAILWARWQDVSKIRQEADRAAHPGPRELA
jgi:hypothetical protein